MTNRNKAIYNKCLSLFWDRIAHSSVAQHRFIDLINIIDLVDLSTEKRSNIAKQPWL